MALQEMDMTYWLNHHYQSSVTKNNAAINSSVNISVYMYVIIHRINSISEIADRATDDRAQEHGSFDRVNLTYKELIPIYTLTTSIL